MRLILRAVDGYGQLYEIICFCCDIEIDGRVGVGEAVVPDTFVRSLVEGGERLE